jgi:GNAT superfamily N-acetyltransferase
MKASIRIYILNLVFSVSLAVVEAAFTSRITNHNAKLKTRRTTPRLQSSKINRNEKKSEEGVRFRPGGSQDELQIKLTMAKNLMNPLSIQADRFIVAVDPTDNSNLYGWAQLRPIGTSLRNSDQYDALPGSGSIEREVNEEIWEDFENDEMDVPVGFASLPWTKEYKDYMIKSEERTKKRIQRMKQMEEEQQRGENTLWELASVYVKPEWRKLGIGSELIKRVLAKHSIKGRRNQDVYLLTLDSTSNWYKQFGFQVTDEPPASMALEITAGNVITGFLGSKLVCMRGS